MKKFFQEFKQFAMRGNVIDLAVGVVIGSAFTAIVTSLVGDLITPVIGMLLGGVHIEGLVLQVGEAQLAYGKFLQAVLNFFIVALCLFSLVKGVNALMPKHEAAPAKPKRLCPYCYGEIHDDAKRCPHCTSELKNAP